MFRFHPYKFPRRLAPAVLIYPGNIGRPLAEYVAAFNELNHLKA